MRKLAAEALGTFAIVFFGCGTIVFGAPKFGPLAPAVGFGIALAVMMASLGPISGGHFNPAVTAAMALAKRGFGAKDALGYVAAQVAGGLAGAGLVLSIAGGRPTGAPLAADAIANGFDRLSPGYYGLGAVFAAEVTLTALFVLVVLATTEKKTSLPVAPIAAGLTYALAHLVGMPIDRLGMNPARSLGAAIFARGDAMAQVWVFLAAPLAGAVLAAVMYRVLTAKPAEEPSRMSSRIYGSPQAAARAQRDEDA